ncbi:carbamoyltransferase family member [Holotrichia oblita]|nr:carbamoyltransferase family member [Holotrichia oblita]
MEVVLVNSNPATIMTDRVMADSIYIEPLTVTTLQRIIELEKPDSLLPSLGGQTGLTLSMQLSESGFLDKHGVKLLGMRCDTINKAEDRQLFKQTMQEIGQPCIPSKVVNTVPGATDFAETIGYPVIVRPAFTLGGAGGGIAENPERLREIASGGLALSPIKQVLIEKSIYGWKEIEFEIIRDGAGNMVAVCSMENLDPVGIHTGDSIVVAPTMTLSDKEYQMLRRAAFDIVEALKIEGGCNCQFALKADSMEYAVIEVNPRVSRSSALASKATGYPIAKVATLIALGYNLDEIPNSLTGKMCACFEPAIDYCVVKLPKWPFDKFIYAKRQLGTQMKATGEVMAIGTSFEMALLKAIRGAENLLTLSTPAVSALTDKEVENSLMPATDYRLFVLYEALKRGISVDVIAEKTMIDRWFLDKINNLVKYERSIKDRQISGDEYLKGKKLGYTDKALQLLSRYKLPKSIKSVFKMVDTCAAEFSAQTPYFYSTYDNENEALQYKESHKTDKKRVIVFGSGPIRIGQGIEFDYASVHCVWALKALGYEVIIVNNNPETVSTDFDTADRLYFEPLFPEDVDNIIATEKPYGVVVAFGGQTAIKLTKHLSETGVRILGTSADSIDAAEDRERFDALLERFSIKRPKGHTVHTEGEALKASNELGYPVLMRPSYVLGGQNMIIAFSDSDIIEYMDVILRQNPGNTILIDKYLMGTEIEVDAICDGEDILIPGIMEHIERAGIHSGDSMAVYPAPNINDAVAEKLVDYTKKLALALETKGLINIQYIVTGGEIYVIEVNPRSSRTVPYISKVTGVPMIYLATACMMGKKLSKLGFGTGLYRPAPYIAVKVPIFSFEKLTDLDTHLGPEMKSTGEVLGIGKTLDEALYKGLTAAGYNMKKEGGGVLVSVRDSDKPEICNIAKMYLELGYKLYATSGTADVIEKSGIPVTRVDKICDNVNENTFTLLDSGRIDLMISTSTKGRIPTADDVKLRRKAVTLAIPHLTSIDTASALAFSLKSRYSQKNTELVNINRMRTEKQRVGFTKMHGCGNDYIYIDCLTKAVENMESIAVSLSDRHRGVGGDGAVFILPSEKADARMRIFNADGSEYKMCANAVRCVAKYLYDNKKVDKKQMTIETKSGIISVQLFVSGGLVSLVSVDMGMPALLQDSNVAIDFNGKKINGYKLNMGGINHLVVFTDDVSGLSVEETGRFIEKHPQFRSGIDIEFVQVIDPAHIKMRAWERGIGETDSYSLGACSVVVAATEKGLLKKGTEVTVRLLGGELSVRYGESSEKSSSGDKIILTGDAVEVYKGTVKL